MLTATSEWREIAKYFKDVLESSNPKNFRIDHKNFSEFLKVLWVIGKLNEILPMVRDSLEQWDWFREGNRNLRLTFEETSLAEDQFLTDVDSDKRLLNQQLKSRLQGLDKARYDLENCEEEFKTLHTSALSLKDSVSSTSTAKRFYILNFTSCCN